MKNRKKLRSDLDLFLSNKTTLNSAEIELVYNDIVSQSLRIEGISIPGM